MGTTDDRSSDALATRRSLLSRLRNWDDAESWRVFFDTYWKLIYSVALKSGLTEAEAEDVVQETIVSVAKKMAAFRYDPAIGSFKGWLLQLTRWRILGQFRKRQPHRHEPLAEGAEDEIEGIPDPAGVDLAALWDEQWRQHLLQVALERVKRKCNPREYQMFDLYVLQQQSAKQTAQALGTSITHVYVAKHRLSALLQKELRHLEQSLL